MKNPRLIVLGGLPGVGKTSIAREIVKHSPFAYLRIDIIEQALRKTGPLQDVGPFGYVLAYGWASSNLTLGMSVVADCVNPLAVTREAWRSVAANSSSSLLQVEVVCSDRVEHRRHVKNRGADIPDFTLPKWEAVLFHAYEDWIADRMVIDSALLTPREAAHFILEKSLGDPTGG